MSRGRHSVFKGKDDGVRVQGVITKAGAKFLDSHRRELRALYRRLKGETIDISDADVIEYLARGRAATEAYLDDL